LGLSPVGKTKERMTTTPGRLERDTLIRELADGNVDEELRRILSRQRRSFFRP
jgi:hypothetical protein